MLSSKALRTAANRGLLAATSSRSAAAVVPLLPKHCSLTPRFLSAAAPVSNNGGAAASPDITLYQYQICPFCNIVKALMSFADVKHNIVEVNPLTKSEIKWSKDYRKVPIATFNGTQVNGSEEIVQEILKDPSIASLVGGKLPNGSVQSPETQKWVDFAKEDLASLLYPNICRTLGDSRGAFGYVKDVNTFSPLQKFAIQNVGSVAMYFAASKIKQKRNISDERQALNDVLARLEEEGFSGGKNFLSGSDKPDLGDLAVYGVLRSIEGLPTHKEVFEGRDESSPLPAWYKKMKSQMSQDRMHL